MRETERQRDRERERGCRNNGDDDEEEGGGDSACVGMVVQRASSARAGMDAWMHHARMDVLSLYGLGQEGDSWRSPRKVRRENPGRKDSRGDSWHGPCIRPSILSQAFGCSRQNRKG